MADDPRSGGGWRSALREKAGSSAAYLLASATTAGGAAAAVWYPNLYVILAIMIAPQIHALVSSIMEWCSQRGYRQLQWSYQRQHQKIMKRALAFPEDENLRMLLILHATTRPDHLGPPPAAP